MAEFKDRAEYEEWKAKKLKEAQEKQGSQTKQESQEKSSEQGRTSEPASEKTGPEKKGPEMPSVPAGSGGDGNLMDVGDLFRNSWNIFKRRFGTLLGLYIISMLLFVIPFAIFMGGGAFMAYLFPDLKIVLLIVWATVAAITGMLGMCWGLGAFTYAVVDEDLGIGAALGKGWGKMWAFLWLYSIAGYIITGGFFLFLVPGFIFLIWFAFSLFIVVEEDVRGMNAMLKSRSLVKGHWFDIFLRLLLVWMGYGLLSACPCIGFILSLLFYPFVMIYNLLIYRDMKSIKGEVPGEYSSGEKFKWILVGTLGYVFFITIILLIAGAAMFAMMKSISI